MRIFCVSDNEFYKGPAGGVYTTAAFPLEYIGQRLPYLTRFCFWVKLLKTDQVEGMFRLDNILEPSRTQVSFVGPFGQMPGPCNFGLGVLKSFPRLYSNVRNSDVIWIRVPAVYSSLAWIFRGTDQLKITQQSGDAVESVGKIYPKLRFLGRFLAYLDHRFAGQADIATFVSENLRAKYGAQATQTLVFHNSRIARDMLWERQAKQLHNPMRLLFVGRVSEEKGLRYAIEALAQLSNVELRVVGEGRVVAKYKQLSCDLGVSERIMWVGRLRWGDPLFSIMRESDALVLPSLTEGLPQVVVEAICNSLPVIATNVGGIPEIIKNGCNGILVPPNSSPELVAAINKIRSGNLWARMCHNAFESAKIHTVENQLGRLLSVIDDWWKESCTRR